MVKSKFSLHKSLVGSLGILICFFSHYSCVEKKILKTALSKEEKVIPATKDIYKIIDIALKDIPFVGKIRLMEVLPNDSSGYEFLFDKDLTTRVENVYNFHEYLKEFQSNFRNTVSYSIEENRIPNIELVEENIHLGDIPFEEKFQTIEPFLIIYSPMMSDDGRLAIVSIDEICFGLCGSGYALILSKGTKNWEKVGIIYRWVS